MLSYTDVTNEKNCVKYIDINCDLAQSFGVYKNDLELDLLPYCSSVNVSCGLHSGDPTTINNTLKFLSRQNQLEIGAHIGYPDIQGFGYREMNLDDDEIEALVLYQIGAIKAMANEHNLKICHVRPHGALYKKAIQDFQTMLAIAKAVKKAGDWLILVCAASDNLEKVAEKTNIKIAGEVFLDKKYDLNGLPLFNQQDVLDIDYYNKMLFALLNESSVINGNGGMSKINFSSIHLSVKHSYSKDIANIVKSNVKEILPLSAAIINDNSWI